MRIQPTASVVTVLLCAVFFYTACATHNQPPVAVAPPPPAPAAVPPTPAGLTKTAPVHVGPAFLYPDPMLTPGKFDTVSFDELTMRFPCPTSIHKPDCTYSQSHRSVNSSDRTKIYDEYNVPANQRNGKAGEIDHFDPLCNGGSNDKENLWFQPAHAMFNGKDFGFKTKDRLESFICVEMKAKRLDPKVAYDRITTDWVQFYLDNESKLPRSGGGVE